MDYTIKILQILLSWPVIIGLIALYILKVYGKEITTILSQMQIKALRTAGIEVEFIQKAQTQIVTSASERTLAVATPPTPQDKDVLFDAIWKIIFKGQIQILEYLEQHGATKKSNLVETFKNISTFLSLIGKTDFTYDTFIMYLTGQGLILTNINPEDQTNPILDITPLGKEFLSYLRTKYPNQTKPL